MCEIWFALKVTWQEYFEVLQPQTELIAYKDVELAQFPFSMCFIASKNIGAQPLSMTYWFYHWHLGILLSILILWYLISCLGDVFLNWICIKFGILLWELLLLVQELCFQSGMWNPWIIGQYGDIVVMDGPLDLVSYLKVPDSQLTCSSFLKTEAIHAAQRLKRFWSITTQHALIH